MKRGDSGDWITGLIESEPMRHAANETDQAAGPSDDASTTTIRNAFTPGEVPTSEDNPELPRYTMALKERGDVDDFEPEYDISTLSLVPPRFKAVVCVGRSSYEGHSNTKKKAKHLASKSACLGLGISL